MLSRWLRGKMIRIPRTFGFKVVQEKDSRFRGNDVLAGLKATQMAFKTHRVFPSFLRKLVVAIVKLLNPRSQI